MEFNIRISDEGLKKFVREGIKSSREAPARFRRNAYLLVAVAFFLVVAIGAWKWVSRHREASAREAEIAAGPRVRVAPVTQSKPEYSVTVIGEARPFAEVTLYAKVSGYLKSVLVDKGDLVKRNQELAVIESPETDKEYNGAQSDAKNKRRIADRMELLAKRNLVSAQEVEQADSDAEVSQARFESTAVQKGYETLRAPFAGTITARFADPGALVQNAANAQTSALPLVTISQIDHLRIYVYLDQKDARYVRRGDAVNITLSDRPGFAMPATVTRLSGSLDEKTRMLLTEVDIDNAKEEIVPGSYVQAQLTIHRPAYLEVPVEALVTRGGVVGSATLPIVTKDNTIHYKEVGVADNDGKLVDIRSGLDATDTVALDVGTVPEGGKIRPIVPEAKK